MLARLLAVFPGWITGRIGPRARRQVQSWTKKNAILRTLRYGYFRRSLMWSADHPLAFAIFVAASAAGVAFVAAIQNYSTPWRLGAPELNEDFDVAAYVGVPWTVQATIVALVYPIVLSFIALMLQRRSHSAVALRVYVLDSAVVPAGASSIGLLVSLGIQYFSTPYSTPCFLAQYMAPLLVMNGTWLLINVLLTGLFLSRTIRFIQEEEQRYAFTRVAVDVALRSELTSALKQHIYLNTAQSDWGFPEIGFNEGSEPRVQMIGFGKGRPEVKRDLKGNLALHDVHLHLLKYVTSTWSRRVARTAPSAVGRTPILLFPPQVGRDMSGEVILCAVVDGPPLNFVERLLVRAAFLYRSSRQGTLSLSTRKMLEEIGGEVEAAAEQQRFGVAADRFRDMLSLHSTLLLASAADAEEVAGNTAIINRSPYAWGASTFDEEWLQPYRDIGRIAVNCLDEDVRLFRAVANVPARIARQLPSRPEKLLIDAQLVGMNLAYQLAGWWTRKADASLIPGATVFSGILPAPMSKAYEQAVVEFISGWSQFRIEIPEDLRGNEAHSWQAITGRARGYAKHIDNSVRLFLKAVSRGDETGSTWLLDHLLKWWGNRQHELECFDIEMDLRVHHVTMTLADKDWSMAHKFLWDGSEPITIEFAEKALNLAIRRYWESMRLYVVLLLIQNAGSNPTRDNRELRFASALILGASQRTGGTVKVLPLNTFDSVMRRILDNLFGVETALKRIDGFAESLSEERAAPEVSGWIYTWSSTPAELESMKRAQNILLVALASARRNPTFRSEELIGQWWKDIDKLESVAQYCADLRCDVLSGAFSGVHGAVSVLQQHFGNTHRIRAGCLAVATGMKWLREFSKRERQLALRVMSVDAAKVQGLLHRIASLTLEAKTLPAPISALEFDPGLVVPSMKYSFNDLKKRYLEGVDPGPDSGLADFISNEVRRQLLAWSFEKLVINAGLAPVNSSRPLEPYEADQSEMQNFLSKVVSQCSALIATGADPVILVGNSGPRALLSAHWWGPDAWKCPLPAGIIVSAGETANGATAVSLINGVPVFEFEIPNGDCFVVPAGMLKTIAVAGSTASSAVSGTWSTLGDDRLEFVLCWQSGFLPTRA